MRKLRLRTQLVLTIACSNGKRGMVKQILALLYANCLTLLTLFAHLLNGGNHVQPTGLSWGLSNTLTNVDHIKTYIL